MSLGRLACLALLLASSAKADVSATASAAPAVGGVPEFAASAQASLEGELARLDGGELSQALMEAARQGRGLRLLLDPSELGTRLQGSALKALTPTVEVRWMVGAGKPRRWLCADGVRHLLWSGTRNAPLERPASADGPRRRFEKRWHQAQPDLPEAQKLDDALKALPDPSEGQPHYIRRREGAGAGD